MAGQQGKESEELSSRHAGHLLTRKCEANSFLCLLIFGYSEHNDISGPYLRAFSRSKWSAVCKLHWRHTSTIKLYSIVLKMHSLTPVEIWHWKQRHSTIVVCENVVEHASSFLLMASLIGLWGQCQVVLRPRKQTNNLLQQGANQSEAKVGPRLEKKK